MKRKAPLSMMELMVMIAVFALASALCLQAFVRSDQVSRRSEARDRAAVLCQSVAEAIQHNGGDFAAALRTVTGADPVSPGDAAAGMFFVDYDENWDLLTGGDTVYRLQIKEIPNHVRGLGKAAVVLERGGGEEILFELEVTWQKGVTPRG